MKKLLLLAIGALFILSAKAAPPLSPLMEKIQKHFTSAYPGVNGAKWHKAGDYYQVYFVEDGRACRIDFDEDAKVVRSLITYSQENLSPFLKLKIGQKYPGKTILGVTELSTRDGHMYQIVLRDNKFIYKVNSDVEGNLSLSSKLKRAD